MVHKKKASKLQK